VSRFPAMQSSKRGRCQALIPDSRYSSPTTNSILPVPNNLDSTVSSEVPTRTTSTISGKPFRLSLRPNYLANTDTIGGYHLTHRETSQTWVLDSSRAKKPFVMLKKPLRPMSLVKTIQRNDQRQEKQSERIWMMKST
jgi:hypothetical protein